MSFLCKLAFYPSIYYGIALEYLGLRKWYTRIDENCILGALPMKRNYLDIIRNEKISAVLTLNQDHELKWSVSKAEWENHGVDFLQVSINDFTGVANLDQIKQSLSFISKHKSKNQCVYVHCKAGRYRSALIVACYLILHKNMNPSEAVEHLKKIRPNVILEKERQLLALNKYFNYLNKKLEK
ncbi:phosphatidylglycerophosphatase and -tyrosine phosphatase 1-like isoform X1 [Brachionus plicatilis]|uniref:Phosphatidylglycerophosphatase and protein-tyrosine phosphatase 1 n=1 Tax=Brachionus plicatilis TaxID=10195 RepID=A0A3M7Q1U0_BRAPC|nr:phosphatidylglycerophosphatase and -tyrosine phosphatase 1-like isoform X1 [Brachionus plicatilis]